MKLRLFFIAFSVAVWLIISCAYLWPMLAMGLQIILDGVPPREGYTFVPRQWNLLLKSVGMSVAATVMAIIFAVPGACLAARSRRVFRVSLFAGFLLCPPMVSAFGWEGLTNILHHGVLRSILLWSFWGWPMASLILGYGWSRMGEPGFEAALLSATPRRAFLHVGLPSILDYVVLSASILFVIFFTDYGIPHSCGVQVFSTELLSWAGSSEETIDAVWPAIPALGLTLGAVLAMFILVHRLSSKDNEEGRIQREPRFVWAVLLSIVFIVTGGAPLAGLASRLPARNEIVNVFRVYGGDLLVSLLVSGAAALMIVALALGTARSVLVRRWVLVFSLVFGTIPGALVGSALVAAYNHPMTGFVYDHWPIVALCYVGRFGWIGCLAGLLMAKHIDAESVEQARIDGASEGQILWHIQWPRFSAILAAVFLVTVALSAAEVAASSLVRVPSYWPVAHIIIEKFHRLEFGAMVTLSFVLVGAGFLGAIGVLVLVGTRKNFE